MRKESAGTSAMAPSTSRGSQLWWMGEWAFSRVAFARSLRRGWVLVVVVMFERAAHGMPTPAEGARPAISRLFRGKSPRLHRSPRLEGTRSPRRRYERRTSSVSDAPPVRGFGGRRTDDQRGAL